MKQKFILSLIILCCFLQHGFSQIPTTGLVGYWPFNGNAHDESGNGNHGTVNGATLTTDRFGNNNQAYYFNGTTDNIDINVGNYNQLTISVWFKAPNQSKLYPTIYAYNGGELLTGIINYPSWPNQHNLRFYYRLGTQGVPNIIADDNTWHNCIIAIDIPNNYYKIIIDNNLISEGIPYGTTAWELGTQFLLGKEASGPSVNDTYFKGVIDDIRFYNRVLDTSEITAIYHEGNWSNLNQGLVAYYPFNGNANDESGNENHGTVIRATLTTDRFGTDNSAYSFSGNDYIISDLGNLKKIGVSFWAKTPPPATAWPEFFMYNQLWFNTAGSGANPADLGKVVVRKQIANNNAYDVWTPGKISNYSWHHYYIFYDSLTNFLTLYMDGALVGNGLHSASGGFHPELVNNIFTMGASTDSLSGHFLTGQLDDIRIYNRNLDSSEIFDLYHEGNWSNLNQGLVAYYPFNGNANDESGNGNHGAVNGAVLSTDRVGNTNSSYSFDGTNYINCGSGSSLNLTNALTLNCWAITSASVANCGILGRWSNNSNPANQYNLYFSNTSGDKVHSLLNADAYNNTEYAFNYHDNQWHLYSMSYDGDSNKLYVDGELVSALPCTGSIQNYTNDFLIGAYSLASGHSLFWNGKIDDIRIYNRALSSDEIEILYLETLCHDTVVNDTLVNYVSNLEFQPQSPEIIFEFTDSLYTQFGGCDSIVNRYSKFVYDPTYCTLFDTTHISVFDTTHISVFDTTHINVFDTTHITVFDTTFITVYDTTHILVYDTLNVTIYDTSYVSVTDTLIIDVSLSINPLIINSIKIYPNPTKDNVIINTGNYALMNNYTIKIENNSGQLVFQSSITQPEFIININDFGEYGIYFIKILDNNNNVIITRKIVLY